MKKKEKGNNIINNKPIPIIHLFSDVTLSPSDSFIGKEKEKKNVKRNSKRIT